MKLKVGFLDQLAVSAAYFCFGIASVAEGQSVSEIMADVQPPELANAFIGNCILNEGNIDRIESVARLVNFVELDPSAMAAFGALDASPQQTGWIATSGEGAPYLLAVNRGEIDNREMNICSISNPFLTATVVVETWLSKAGAVQLLSDETRFGQRERVWQIENWIDGALVISVEGSQEVGGGITLSLVVPSFE